MLEFDSVTKSYGGTVVLDDLSFAIQSGQMFGFCGANGAGKTTAMRIALGLVRACRGEVRWNGRTIDLEMRRRIGYMPEERGLYPKMRVLDQLTYFGMLHGMTKTAAHDSALPLIDRLGVNQRTGEALEKLSLGNQQKVQLAAALVHMPEVLILDEPFSGLDPVGVDALADVLLERCRAGVPVVFSSHQLDLVERLCDSVGIINGGRMVAQGSVNELREREGNRQLRVVVLDASPGWAAQVRGVHVLSQQGSEVLLELDDPARDQEVLAAAQRTGRVQHFSWRAPTLTELFREAVAA
ncbi:MAG: ATP-binding cassette domain-containing protein [Geodermatophilaceae bacterium]|nr:ATP-binding cassette domain-containing protein [Geodermatophilaceae bacterium]MDQ3463695.1 ATP-binding cassette domain-containing protein [Actinomycetota bacterium]